MKRFLLSLSLFVCLGFAVGCGDDGGGDDGGQQDAGVCTPAAAGSLELYEACCEASGSECSSGLCFQYGNGEQRCSKTCSGPADCPAPSPGCSGMGVCQRPGG